MEVDLSPKTNEFPKIFIDENMPNIHDKCFKIYNYAIIISSHFHIFLWFCTS
jgi:hypothetical protein